MLWVLRSRFTSQVVAIIRQIDRSTVGINTANWIYGDQFNSIVSSCPQHTWKHKPKQKKNTSRHFQITLSQYIRIIKSDYFFRDRSNSTTITRRQFNCIVWLNLIINYMLERFIFWCQRRRKKKSLLLFGIAMCSKPNSG